MVMQSHDNVNEIVYIMKVLIMWIGSSNKRCIYLYKLFERKIEMSNMLKEKKKEKKNKTNAKTPFATTKR